MYILLVYVFMHVYCDLSEYVNIKNKLQSVETDSSRTVELNLKNLIPESDNTLNIPVFQRNPNLEIFNALYYIKYAEAYDEITKNKTDTDDININIVYLNSKIHKILAEQGFISHPLLSQELFLLERNSLKKIILTKNRKAYEEYVIQAKRPDGLNAYAHAFYESFDIFFFYRYSSRIDDNGYGHIILNSKIADYPIEMISMFEVELTKYAKERIIEELKLFPEIDIVAISNKGMLFSFNMRINFSCYQLTHYKNNHKTTRQLQSFFVAGRGFIPKIDISIYSQKKSIIVNDIQLLLTTNDFIALRLGKWKHIGYFNDNFIPFNNNDDFVTDNRQLSIKFATFTEKMITENDLIDKVSTRLRVPISINQQLIQNALIPINPFGRSLISSLNKTNVNLQFSVKKYSNINNIFYGGNCHDGNIYNDKEYVIDSCIILPVSTNSLYADERFFIQCKAWYPVNTMLFIISNTKEGIDKKQDNIFNGYICENRGWSPISNYFDISNPYTAMSICTDIQNNRSINSATKNSISTNALTHEETKSKGFLRAYG